MGIEGTIIPDVLKVTFKKKENQILTDLQTVTITDTIPITGSRGKTTYCYMRSHVEHREGTCSNWGTKGYVKDTNWHLDIGLGALDVTYCIAP